LEEEQATQVRSVSKAKAVRFHPINAQRGIRGRAALILNLVITTSIPDGFSHQNKAYLLLSNNGLGWPQSKDTVEPSKIFGPAGKRNKPFLGHPTCGLINTYVAFTSD
jgi:hypothetical protein